MSHASRRALLNPLYLSAPALCCSPFPPFLSIRKMAAAQQGQAALANVGALALPDGNLAILDQDLSALLTKNNVNQVLHQQLQSL